MTSPSARSLQVEIPKQFDTSNPATLRTQLERFAEKTQNYVTELSRRRAPVLEVNGIGRTTMDLEFGKLNRIDTSDGGSVMATLPADRAQDAGSGVEVVKTSQAGIVYLRPPGPTSLINGAELVSIERIGRHWVSFDGEHYWCGSCSGPAVEILHIGTLAGVTTGALTAGGITDADPLDLNRLLVAMFVIQAATFAQTPTISTQPTVGLTDLAGNTTVVGRFVHAFANMLPDWQTGSLGIVHPDEANDLLGLAVLLSGARQNHRIRRNATTFTATSTSLELTTTYPGALIIDMIANDDATDTATPGTGQTALANGSAGGATVSLQASYKPMPIPGTTTMSWSGLTAATNKAHIAIVIEPAELGG